MTNEPKPDATHEQRFDAMLTGLFSVPKAEILKRESEYKKQRKTKKDGGKQAC